MGYMEYAVKYKAINVIPPEKYRYIRSLATLAEAKAFIEEQMKTKPLKGLLYKESRQLEYQVFKMNANRKYTIKVNLWKSIGDRTEVYRDYYHKDFQNIDKVKPPFFQNSAIAMLQTVLKENTTNLLATKLSEYLDPEVALITREMKALLESRNLY